LKALIEGGYKALPFLTGFNPAFKTKNLLRKEEYLFKKNQKIEKEGKG